MCRSLQIRTVTSLAGYNNLPAEFKGDAQQLRITRYNTFTNPDETDCFTSNLGITFGAFPWKDHEPKVQITAQNRQNGRVFKNLDGPDERILSPTSPPKSLKNTAPTTSERHNIGEMLMAKRITGLVQANSRTYRRRPRGNYLRKKIPFHILKRMYEDATCFHQQYGWGARKIAKWLTYHYQTVQNYGREFSWVTICGWIYRGHSSRNSTNTIDWSKGYELGYLIGARLSDANPVIGKKNNNYGLEIAAKDKDYALEFARAGSRVHQRNKPYAVGRDINGYWRVYIPGREIAELLSGDFVHIKSLVEGNREIARGVARSFFDGDGSVGSSICAYNSDMKILELVVDLLRKHFGINAYVLPKPMVQAGKKILIRDKICVATKDHYRLYIPRRYLLIFYNEIGFAIERKQKALAKLVKKLRCFSVARIYT